MTEVDLRYITVPYSNFLEQLKILLSTKVSFMYWLGDKEDDLSTLVNRLMADIKEAEIRQIRLTGKLEGEGGYRNDPWLDEIIPYADNLSQSNIERAVLLLRTDDINESNERSFLKRFVVGIDDYLEKAGRNRRYPILFLTPQRYIKLFSTESESTMPNWGGFYQRTKTMILERS